MAQRKAQIPPPEKLSRRLIDYPGYKNRNPVAAELQILGGLFLEAITRAPEVEDTFLKECYCPSGALSQYALVSKEILRTRYSIFFEKEAEVKLEEAQLKGKVAPEVFGDVVAASLARRPIILLGDVGVGKSIFIRHLVRVDASEQFERALVLYLNFGGQPALADELKAYVRGEFISQLLEKHGIDIFEDGFVRGVYHFDLERFGRGIYQTYRDSDPDLFRQKEVEFLAERIEDEEEHLRRSLDHAAKAQRRQIVVFLDNVDQRPATFQEECFLIAQALAETWPATCFVSLRPDTFLQSRATGALAAYQPRVFTIRPPRVDRVIERRLRFGKAQLESYGRLPNFPTGLTIDSDTLNRYLDVLLDGFSKNERLVSFVDNMSGGNTRRALDFLVAFVGSGHVDAEKILRILEESGSYTLPVHEFLRAVIYGNYEHFEPNESPIANLFDISSADGREHFLLSSILEYVSRAAEGTVEQGYVAIESIFDFAQGLRFTPQ
ncbi:MAG: hypothetical protein H0U53_10390 [Actinobacteria bacterium]|nr:hypothetical protein [Actinomycetota bacterium]